jgi:hypothetical protein
VIFPLVWAFACKTKRLKIKASNNLKIFMSVVFSLIIMLKNLF